VLKKRESERNTKLLMVGSYGNYDWPIAFGGYVLHVLSQSDFPQLPKRKIGEKYLPVSLLIQALRGLSQKLQL